MAEPFKGHAYSLKTIKKTNNILHKQCQTSEERKFDFVYCHCYNAKNILGQLNSSHAEAEPELSAGSFGL